MASSTVNSSSSNTNLSRFSSNPCFRPSRPSRASLSMASLSSSLSTSSSSGTRISAGLYGQNTESIASEICGFITVLTGTVILHETREEEQASSGTLR
ncbi:hypothetical protein YC2023_116359 [Brassica napus]